MPKRTASKSTPTKAPAGDATAQIDARIEALGDWRGDTLAALRALIHAAVPDVVEEVKWGGTPVWSKDGILCTGESYKQVVKLTFARGASLPDPAGLFNSSLEGNTRRAIDVREGESVDKKAFKALLKAAVAANAPAAKAKTKGKAPAAKPARTNAKALPAAAKPVRLLSGGNPQIPKGDGDAPVQAYIDALPGWKREAGQWIDGVIVQTLPGVKKAVKWNSPFYGVEGEGWFLGVHAFAKYLKIAFFKGSQLRPPPPGPSKSDETRYYDLHEDDPRDAKQLARWVKQAAALPGWKP